MNKKKSTPGRNKTAKGSRTQIARRSKRSPARASSNKKEKNTKRILPIIICSFLALLLVFGIVLGTIALIKEMRSVVSYNGVRIDKGVASYLAATYKATYKGDKKDTAALDASIEQYIRRIVVGAYLYDKFASESAATRADFKAMKANVEAWVEQNTAEVLEYKAEGSIDVFNKNAKPMGFDFKDFKKGTELIYKAVCALDTIYGASGSALTYSDAASVEICEEYFKEYTHVKVLFIRTETVYVLEDGERIPNGDGTYMTNALQPAEKAERAADIAEIAALIENAKNHVGTEISLEAFNEYYDKYNDEPAYAESGYYLHPDSDFTAYWSDGEFPNLVEKAFSMSIGDWGQSKDGETVCFIYKYATLSPDYADSDLYRFFTDFYSNAAERDFMKSIDELAPDVKVKKKYHQIGVASLEKNSLYKIMGVGIGLDW